MFALALFDVYRAVLLFEIVTIGVLYAGSFVKYLHRARKLEDAWLRGFRLGQAARVSGVFILLLVFAIAVISSFGEGDLGRTLFNLLIQVALWLFAVAWGLVDLPRFRAVSGRPHEAIAEIDRIDREAIERRRRRTE